MIQFRPGPSLGIALPFVVALALPSIAHAATSCETISPATFSLGRGATAVSAWGTEVTAGSFLPPGATTPITGLPPFCRVQVTASSNGNPKQSLIAIEVWLPERAWNGRFIGTGNGGFGGTLDYVALSQRLQEGFAVGNSDLGTGLRFACNPLSCGDSTGGGSVPGGLYRDPQSIKDFGYAATHVMTVAGKQVTDAFYGTRPSHSYFAGCSTGGQNALAESQRFPSDYDGILAGAPAHNRTHLNASIIPIYANSGAAGGYLTNAALGLIHARVLAQCAGHDGGLATDDFLEQPYSCPTDARTLVCHGAPDEVPCTDPTSARCSCLTGAQANTMDADWQGPDDDLGRRESPGFARGSEEPVPLTPANSYIGDLGLTWTQLQAEPPFDSLYYWTYGPAWQWPSFVTQLDGRSALISGALDRTDMLPVGDDTFAGVLNANDPDLSAFARHGGRMLLYQGYGDPLIPSAVAINYYTAVFANDPGRIDNYLRLFMAPGVEHCDGGPGANSFGATSQPFPPAPLDPKDDALGALMAWVEHGDGPTRITATKYVNDTPADGIAFQRPLCQYPLHAAYRGGNPTKAASFACAPSIPVLNQMADQHWGN
jgi:feruloyl esterase